MSTSQRSVRMIVIWSAALLGVLAFAGSASAHAALVSSSPASAQVLNESPAQIVLNFDESVDIVPGSIRLVDASGRPVDVSGASHEAGSSSISASVPSLGPGTYVVAWRAISVDSHPISGAFTFSVKTQTATAPGLVQHLLDAEHADRADELMLGVGRALSYAGLAVLIGAFVVVASVDRAALGSTRLRRVLLGAAVAGVIGTAVMVAFQAAISGGGALSPSAWSAVAQTRAGGWWVVRLGLLALGAGLPWVARRYRSQGIQPMLMVLYITAVLAVTAAGGHATTGRWIPLGYAATVVHLGAMAVWVGGLAGLVFVVPADRRLAAGAGFSRLALLAVGTLAVTGTINAWRQSASVSQLIDSSYGTWLIIKLAIVAVVLVVASRSRRAAQGTHGESGPTDPGRARFTRLILIEVVGMALILGATAGLVSSAPPRQAATGPLSVSVVEGDRLAQLVLDPPVSGGTIMHIYVTSMSGSISGLTSIVVTADLPAQDITGLVIPMETAGPGHLTSNDVNLPVPGTWTITVTAKYGEFDQSVFRLQATVR
jgi:copper transport protein